MNTLSTTAASIPGRTVRAFTANPVRPVAVSAVGAMGVRTVIAEHAGRYTVQRWITADGHNVASCGETYYATEKRAINASGDWLAATVTANGGALVSE